MNTTAPVAPDSCAISAALSRPSRIKDVVGLDVPVQKACLMHFLEPVQQGPDRGHQGGLRERLACLCERLQRLATLVVHYHVAGAVRLEVAVHAHDMRMAEASQRARLLAEAVQAPAIALSLLLRDRHDATVSSARRATARQVLLDRDVLFQVCVARQIGSAERACAQQPGQPNLHERGARRECVLVRREGHRIRAGRLRHGHCTGPTRGAARSARGRVAASAQRPVTARSADSGVLGSPQAARRSDRRGGAGTSLSG